MTVDANDPRPPYQQVAEDLRRKIGAGGQYAPGERLPSIRQLAREYGISPQTVQSALRELRSEQLIVAQQGRAFFVRDPGRLVGVKDSEGQLRERLDLVEAQLRDLQGRVAAIEGSGRK
ncbi:MAG TPA: winged helix-turn-helix domain-containing protein [Streptosporangiaceae bacterium]|nr:winged helix-turn-helix domain-containing protein [Streptosporangiaceae bacterium]